MAYHILRIHLYISVTVNDANFSLIVFFLKEKKIQLNNNHIVMNDWSISIWIQIRNK